MRWVFFLLVLANVLGWYWFSAEAVLRAEKNSVHPVEASSGGVNTLVLIGEERQKVESKLLPKDSDGNEVSAPSSSDLELESSVPNSEDLSIDVEQQLVEVEEVTTSEPDSVADDGSLEGSVENLTYAAVVTEPVSEALGSAIDARQQIQPIAAAQTVQASGLLDQEGIAIEYCTPIGPFAAKETALSVSKKLSATLASKGITAAEVPISEIYWLMIPPLADEDASQQLILELKSKKIDSFLIEDGDHRLGVSLGVFGRRENAESYQQRLKVQGYLSEISPLPRFAEHYWLWLFERDLTKLSDEFWQDVKGMLAGESLLVDRQPCTALDMGETT